MITKHEWFDLILSDKSIKHSQFRILMCIWKHMDSRLQAYPSRDKIREITGSDFHTITTATKKAAELGYLKLSYRRHNNSQHRHRMYKGVSPKSKGS